METDTIQWPDGAGYSGGRKAETRRVIKPQPTIFNGVWSYARLGRVRPQPLGLVEWAEGEEPPQELLAYCPYGRAGDRLWVREAWRIVGWWDGEPYYLEYKDGTRLEEPGDSAEYDEDRYAKLCQQCTDDCLAAGLQTDEQGLIHIPEGQPVPTRWRSARFMPRWASRITLENTGVRVERVQDITEEGAIAEGMTRNLRSALGYSASVSEEEFNLSQARDTFRLYWDSLNGKRYPWGSNPWVQVVQFAPRT